MFKKVLIGGLPSSGSTLLSFLLDSHSSISCGPEFGLFCHPFFWEEKNKDKWQNTLITKIAQEWGLSRTKNKYDLSKGFINHNSTIDAHPNDLKWYEISLDEIVNLIKKSKDGKEFFDKFYNYITNKKGKLIFCEKTPPNIYSIKYFLNQVSDSRAFVCVRNPIDTISSLVKRDLKFSTALSIWLVEANIISNLIDNPMIKLVKYESLVVNPVEQINEIFSILGVSLEGSEIVGKNNKNKSLSKRSTNNREYINTWNNKPFEKINSKNILIGLKSLKKNEIISLRCIKLKRKSKINSTEKSFIDIMNCFDYSPEKYLPIQYDLNIREIFYFLIFILKLKLYFDFRILKSFHKSSIRVSSKLIFINLIFYIKNLFKRI